MKVFVSWSGEASHQVADALSDWLPNVIQAVEVFFSPDDIGKGSQWFGKLGEELEQSDFGILCLTPENLNAPWLLYEAGAIGKRLEESRVVPLLIGLNPEDLDDPLRQFNGATLKKGEIRKLVAAINRQLGDNKLPQKQLKAIFDVFWPQLQPKLRKADKTARSESHLYKYEVFLSSPMAAYHTDEEYKAARADVKQVFDAIRQCELRVFWAAEKIEKMDDFDALGVSVDDDLNAIEQSRHFLLIYPEKLPTGALFEAGYAFHLGCPAHYFVRDRDDLPFLMQELTGLGRPVTIHERKEWKDYADLAKKVKKHKDAWFPRE
jgi:hypothetical protein